MSHPSRILVFMTDTNKSPAPSPKKRRLITNKWFIWFVMLIVVPVMLPYAEDNPLMPFAFMYVILFPSLMFLVGTWKILRFNFFPSPVQLLKGFRRQWHVIEKGPVVVRVHRKKPSQSST